MKKNIYSNSPDQAAIFDEGPEEIDLSKLYGFCDCENCYFRTSTVKRITRNVQTLRRGL